MMLAEAIALARLGWAVVPLRPRSKEPLVRWKELRERRLTEPEIIELFGQHHNFNIGIITGSISNLLVLDADAPEVVKKFGAPETPIVETVRGRHYYFSLPDKRIRSATHIADGLDIRAEGGYAVAPPSIHPSGQPYDWILPPKGIDPFGVEPAAPPAWLMELISKHRAQHKALEISQITHGVEQGKRNVSSAALIGKLLGCLPKEDWESLAWPLVCAWNAQNSPPLPEKQLRYTFDCIARKESQKRTQTIKQNDLLEKFVNFISSSFSQQQIAKELNVHQSTVSRLLKTLKNPPTTSRGINFETNIANGCGFSTRKLCTRWR